MFFMKESFKLCSIPPTVNRWLSATPACKYPDKKTAKPYCIENTDKSNLILMTFKVKAFHRILYLLFIHYKNTIVLWWLSCDWMFTSHFPFIVAKRKEEKRNVCMYFYYQKCFSNILVAKQWSTVTLVNKRDEIPPPRYAVSKYTLSTTYHVYTLCVNATTVLPYS